MNSERGSSAVGVLVLVWVAVTGVIGLAWAVGQFSALAVPAKIVAVVLGPPVAILVLGWTLAGTALAVGSRRRRRALTPAITVTVHTARSITPRKEDPR
jgi:hypothetical protein